MTRIFDEEDQCMACHQYVGREYLTRYRDQMLCEECAPECHDCRAQPAHPESDSGRCAECEVKATTWWMEQRPQDADLPDEYAKWSEIAYGPGWLDKLLENTHAD